jgi:hypothetical protein
MPQYMKTNRRTDTCPPAGVTHRAQLLRALPPASVIALEQNVGGRAAGDEALDQLWCFAGESDVAYPPAFRLTNRQRLDIAVIVRDLEATELAVTAACEERRVNEI